MAELEGLSYMYQRHNPIVAEADTSASSVFAPLVVHRGLVQTAGHRIALARCSCDIRGLKA
jgi:hypothetical protein